MPLFIGVDVGGTKVLAGAVDEAGEVTRLVQRSMPGRRVNPALVEDTLTTTIEDVADGEPVFGVGVAAAGLVDAEGASVRFAPHLPWQDADLRWRLSQRWRTLVALDNDANCAARAELVYGAARGANSALVITLGTGIGGALILGGRVHRGYNGMAGEFGHMQVVPAGRACQCGSEGCWEQYCSGNALVRFAREEFGKTPTVLEHLCEGDPDRLHGAMITRAAQDGDLVATSAFASVGEWLGVGAANLVAAIDPERVIIGGGVSAAGELLLGPAREAMTRTLLGADRREVPTLRAAMLGPEAGVVGAGDLVRARAQGRD